LSLAFQCSIAVVCILLCIEDFRNRAVRTIWFALLFGLLLAFQFWVIQDLSMLLQSYAAVLLLFGGMLLYFTLRYKKGLAQLKKSIGAGDVVLLLLFPLILPPFYLLLLIVTSTLIGILGWLFIPSFQQRGIPLAGVQAFLSILFIFSL
tara:strand:- start:1152 stop:1598 length:447 start_codon:yes stop_codon:yes gene_type:complete